MMNDPQWVEAARVLADRAMKEAGDSDEQKLQFISRQVLCRELKRDEREIFLESVGKFREKFKADEPAAAGLVKAGDSKAEVSSELAAWALVASEMMNTDEAMNK